MITWVNWDKLFGAMILFFGSYSCYWIYSNNLGFELVITPSTMNVLSFYGIPIFFIAFLWLLYRIFGVAYVVGS
jgi:hypothetical protein